MFELLILGLPLIMFIRYFVWRGRYAKIKTAIARLEQLQVEVGRELDGLASSLRALGPDKPAQPDQQADADVHSVASAAAADEGAPPGELIAQDERLTDEQFATRSPVELPDLLPDGRQPGGRAASDAARLRAIREMRVELQERAPEAVAPGSGRAGEPEPSRSPTAAERVAEAFARLRANPDLEAIVGASWLNKIGVAVLVIGLALLAGFSLQYLAPLGRLALGVAAGLALLGTGVWLERHQKYALFARPLIGGGWAALYFMAYAAHSLPASRVITDPVLALAVLFAVALAMIAHSLRYRSEIVSGMAYLLGFLAILISPLELGSLVAIGLLAASFAVLYRFLPWYRLSAGMVVATYGALWFWLTRNAGHGPLTPAGYNVLQSILVVYWLIFASCDFLRAPAETAGRPEIPGRSAFNTLAFTALSWTLVHSLSGSGQPGFFAAIALLGLGSSVLARWRGLRFSYLFHALFTAAASALAIYFAFEVRQLPAEGLAIAWGGLAILLGALGVWRRELVLRVGAYGVGVLATAAAFFCGVVAANFLGVAAADDFWLRISSVSVVALALFATEALALRLYTRLAADERRFAPATGYAAALLLASLALRDAQSSYLGLIWLGGALISFEVGVRFNHSHSRFRGYGLMLAAFAALIVNNSNLLWIAPPVLPPLRWLALGAAAAGYLFAALRLKPIVGAFAVGEARLYPLAAHASAALLTIIAWNELPPPAVGLVWALLALAYHEAGARFREPAFRVEAYVLAALAWGRLFLVDFVTVGQVGPLSTRVISGLLVAALLYYFRHTMPPAVQTLWARIEGRLPVLFSFMATIALFALGRFEFGYAATVVAWSALALALLAVGVRLGNWDYRIQAYLVAIFAFARSWTTNLHLSGDFFGLPERLTMAGIVVAMLLAVGLLWRRRRAELAALSEGLPRLIRLIDRGSTALFSFLAVALGGLYLHYTYSGSLLTIAWAFEAVVAITLGFLLRERPLRLISLALLAICLVKGLGFDLQGAETIVRIVSFILLGVLLVAISFVYTRYRHILKSYF